MIIYSKDAEADRDFFRNVLKFPHVDAGEGWLIFALPPAELAVHPAGENGSHELYLLCDDIRATVKAPQAEEGQVFCARWTARLGDDSRRSPYPAEVSSVSTSRSTPWLARNPPHSGDAPTPLPENPEGTRVLKPFKSQNRPFTQLSSDSGSGQAPGSRRYSKISTSPG